MKCIKLKYFTKYDVLIEKNVTYRFVEALDDGGLLSSRFHCESD